MKIEVLTVGPLEENCYLLIDEATNRAVLIDPGDEPARILAALHDSGATLESIWLTHAHFDHLGGLAGVLREHPVPVHMHPLEEPLHARAVDSALRYGFIIEAPPPVDLSLIHISEPTRRTPISYAVFCLKKKKKKTQYK